MSKDFLVTDAITSISSLPNQQSNFTCFCGAGWTGASAASFAARLARLLWCFLPCVCPFCHRHSNFCHKRLIVLVVSSCNHHYHMLIIIIPCLGVCQIRSLVVMQCQAEFALICAQVVPGFRQSTNCYRHIKFSNLIK